MLSVESSLIEIVKKENIHEYWNDTEFVTTVTIFVLFALEILFLIPILIF